ncbi:MAG: glycerol-3-phosphate acyltransferase, partial [Candidatus Bathyarchaeia archaeon]
MNLDILLLASIFYFYGSIPFAFIFTYLLQGKVIYRKGTRNVGVANTFMVAGLPAGFLTVAGEVSKAVLPLVVGNLYYSDDLVISLIFIFSAIIGTNFSVFLKGKGGMGSTILLWTLATLSPYSLLLFFAVSIFAFLATKNSYYTSIIAHLLLPAEIFLIERSTPFTIFGLSTAILFLSKYNRSRDDFKRHNVAEKLKRFMGKRYVIDVGNTSQDPAVNVDG